MWERNFIQSFLWIRWMPYRQHWQNSFLWMFKIASVKVRKRKNLVSVKKRTLFLQSVSVDTWIALFSKLAKSCRKTFEQDLLQVQFGEKNNIFKKERAVSSRNHAPLDNWNAVLNILPNVSTKYPEKNSALTGKRHDFLKRNVFFSVKKFLWKRPKMFKKSGRNFSLAVRKKFCI